MSYLLNKPPQQSWSQQLSESNSNNSHGDSNKNNEDADNMISASNEEEETTGSSSAPPVRKRTRATADQLSVLEDTFAVNVSPNSKLRKQLAEQLQMSERSIQIWFQNRRAKVKHMQKRAQMQMHQASIRAQIYQYHQQQHQQQQQHQHQQQQQQPFSQPLLPMQSAYQQPQQPQHNPYYYNPAAARLAIPPRAQSVDAVQFHYNANINNRLPSAQTDALFTPASSVPPAPSLAAVTNTTYSATPPPMSYPQYYGQQQQLATPWLSSAQDDIQLMRQSMPPQVYPYDLTGSIDSTTGLDFPEYIHGPASPSPSPLNAKSMNATMPTLVSVPDAGPTAVLATSTAISDSNSSKNSLSPAPVEQPIPTIDPSSLIMTPSSESKDNTSDKRDEMKTTDKEKEESIVVLPDEDDEEPKDLYLSATTLTIGTWHRLKMQETDLVCVYRPDTRIFAWHIVDGGCHFKMEVPQKAVSSIEFILDEHEALADVHFDISEPPLFYMESTTTTPHPDMKKKKKSLTNDEQDTIQSETTLSPMWVQCSDFTEGKQASRFFRHTLKGVAHHMKQELLALISNHEETKRLVHFIEPTAPIVHNPYSATMYQPLIVDQQVPHHPHTHLFHPQQHPHPSLISATDESLLMQSAATTGFNPIYWPGQTNAEPIACELYMS